MANGENQSGLVPSPNLVWSGPAINGGTWRDRLARRKPRRGEPEEGRPSKRMWSEERGSSKFWRKQFANGRSGWDGHVGSIRTHPNWYPEVEEAEARKRLFMQEHSDWFVSEP